MKTMLPLRGLAILLVVLAHASIGMLAAETSLAPEADIATLAIGSWQIAAFWNSILLELCRCAVPLFLFLSGYYLLSTPRTWKAVWSTCRKLIVPMLVWSLAGWAFSWRKGFGGWSPLEFLNRLVTGNTQLGYFFIILLVQYYMLSMWLFPAMARKPRSLLALAIALQLGTHLYDYAYHLSRVGVLAPMKSIFQYGYVPEYLFPRFMLSFTLGIWVAHATQRFKAIIVETYRSVVLLSCAAALLLVVERGFLYSFGRESLGMNAFEATAFSWVEWKLTTALWTTAALFLLFGAFQKRIPIQGILEHLGKHALQIFLLHGIVLDITKMFLYKYFSNYRFYGLAGTVTSLIAGIIVPLMIIKIIRKMVSPKMCVLILGA
jgi:fucose 4-O-acetylase-like acetyltransferase